MKKLTALNPKWSGRLRPDSGEALEFDCPKCVPPHRCVVYFVNPLDGKEPARFADERWYRDGTTFDTVTVTPSIDYGANCFHGWIERGRYIDIAEAPVTIPNRLGVITALSPLQALDYAGQIKRRAEAFLK